MQENKLNEVNEQLKGGIKTTCRNYKIITLTV